MTELLLGGILFTIIGLCTFKFSKQKKAAGLTPLIIGLTLIYLTTVGPLSKNQEQINNVLKLDKNQVTYVVIKPIKHTGYDNLTQNIIEVTDRNIIDSLCYFLTKAKITNSVTNSPKWVCLIGFEKTDRSFLEFEVKITTTATFIEVRSNGGYGWNYGSLESKYFGQILLSLTHKATTENLEHPAGVTH